jgi:phosphoadenosine phosphosulfate reductase
MGTGDGGEIINFLERFRPGYEAWAKMDIHKKRVKKSEELINQVLLNHSKPYIAFSTGKDSLCMLDMVYGINPDVDVMFHDSGVELPESYDQIKRIEDNWGIALHIVKNPHDTFELMHKYNDIELGNPSFRSDPVGKLALFEPIRKWNKENNFDLAFIGLRKAESKRRRMMLCTHGNYFYCKSNGIYECFPLSEWKSEDVWAYIFTHYPLENLIHPAYYKDKMVKDPGKLRVSWWCDTNMATNGQFVWLKYYYPELWNKLKSEFPEVASYV